MCGSENCDSEILHAEDVKGILESQLSREKSYLMKLNL